MKIILAITLIFISGCGCMDKGSHFPACLLPCDNGPCQ